MSNTKKTEDLIKICVCKHRSAKSLVYSWYCLPKETPQDKIVNLKQFTDEKETGPICIAINIIQKRKFWGFYRPGKVSEIHLWSHKTCKVKDIMGLLAHEVAHSAGYRSENSAIKIATICQFALHLMLLNFKDKLLKR